jgi:transaldolase
MTLFLDSAFVDDAREAAALGFVTGITTNPTLVARVLNADERLKTREDLIAALCDVFPGTVMVQLAAATAREREDEGRMLLDLRPGRVGLKIPSTMDNFPLARRFAAEGHTVGMTAIFDPGQVYLACEAGAKYIFPYVNRSTRLLGDGLGLVRRMRAVIDALESPLRILAASVKTPEEGVDTILAGAHGLTLPLDVMLAMGHHPLSEQTIEEFAGS